MSFNALKDSVYSYTSLVMNRIQTDCIQIGNEIHNRLFHPEGNRWPDSNQMLSLLQSANKAVRDVNPGTKIITHYAGYEGAENFYTLVQELDYDIIGLPFYLLWRGKSLSELDNALKRLQQKFEKDILIAETAYPFTLGWNDQTNNIVRLDAQLILPYF